MRNKITVTGANLVFFAFTMLFLLFQIVLIVIQGITGQNATTHIYPILLVNEYVLILLPVVIYTLYKKLDVREVFRLRPLRLLPALVIVIMSVPAYFTAAMVNSIVIYLLQFIGKIPNTPIPVPQNISELVVGLIIVALSPGICEEALHRGVLLKAYEKRGTWKALIISSLFFGFFHFDITNFFGPLALGLLIGYYVIRTNSIFAGVLAHFMNNAIAEVLQYRFGSEGKMTEYVTISVEELAASLFYGVAAIILLFLLLRLFTAITRKTATYTPPISHVSGDLKAVVTHWPVIVVLVLYILLAAFYILSVAMIP